MKVKAAAVWMLAGVVGVIVGSSALAAIPDAGGVIHGCYNPARQGSVRVIDTDAGQTCKATERTLNWNEQGPPGLTGPGFSGTYNVTTQINIAPGPVPTAVSARCNPGDLLLDSFYSTSPFPAPADMSQVITTWSVWGEGAAYVSTEDSWEYQVIVRSEPGTADAFTLTVRAVCAAVS